MKAASLAERVDAYVCCECCNEWCKCKPATLMDVLFHKHGVELLCRQQWFLTLTCLEEAHFEITISRQRLCRLQLLQVFHSSLWTELQGTTVYHQNIDGDTVLFCLQHQRLATHIRKTEADPWQIFVVSKNCSRLVPTSVRQFYIPNAKKGYWYRYWGILSKHPQIPTEY